MYMYERTRLSVFNSFCVLYCADFVYFLQILSKLDSDVEN